MKAIILAAGKSTRTLPLTASCPKPLLKILDKSILEHNLDALNGLIDKAIIVIGFKGDMIKKQIGKSYKNIKIKYVEQKRQRGTADAVNSAKEYIKNKAIIMGGDDLFSRNDIKKCLKYKYSILAKEVDEPEKFGILKIKDNKLQHITEKPKKPESNLANTGLYVIDKNIFLEKTKTSSRKELEFTDMVTSFTKKKKIHVIKVKDYWLPISYPWNYLEANVEMLRRKTYKKTKKAIKGTIERGVTIKGNVIIGKNTLIKSGTYIEGHVFIGKNCIIGPNAYIRKDSIIMDNCKIRGEIVDSVIMENTSAKHKCYIGHSVIGKNCNIAAGTITSDYRHDAKEHITLIKGKKVATKRRKLGTFFGDNVMTGIGTLIYPGRKIWPGKTTLPGEIVTKDKL